MTRKGNAPFMLCEKLFFSNLGFRSKKFEYCGFIHALIGSSNEFLVGETTKKDPSQRNLRGKTSSFEATK